MSHKAHLLSFQIIGAILWVLIVLAALVLNLAWFNNNRPQTDIMALLPQTQQSYARTVARQNLSEASQNLVTVLIELVPDAKNNENFALQTLHKWTKTYAELVTPVPINIDPKLPELMHKLALRQMTWADQKALSELDREGLWNRFLNQLAVPTAPMFFSPQEDPFGLASQWMLERASEIPVREANGAYVLQQKNRYFIFALFKINLRQVYDGSGRLEKALDDLTTQLAQTGFDNVLTSGIPLFASHAAQTAQTELSRLGTISLLGVCLLSWLWFRRLRVIGLMLLVIAQAMVVATAATLAIFGQIHLISLVFGTTLIGITVDYSAHYFGKRFGQDEDDISDTLIKLMPSLSLALVSTVIAFLVMANTPMQGLQQMAIFCASGVISAFAAVTLWFPCLDFKLQTQNLSLKKIGDMIAQLPTWSDCRWQYRVILIVLCSTTLFLGLSNIKPTAQLQELNNAPPILVTEALQVSELLHTPSTSQYFIVKGSNLNDLLLKQEMVYKRLADHPIDGVTLSSMSDWIASDERATQMQQIRQQATELINSDVNALLGATLPVDNDDIGPVQARLKELNLFKTLQQRFHLLTPHSALVQIRGLTANNVDDVKALANNLDGITWVDYPQDIAKTLGQYRDQIAKLLALSIATVILILTFRFKGQSWRAFTPTVLGLLMTVALLSLWGMNFSLFSVLALVLLLGLGFDYGIFMTASDQEPETIATIAFAALTTFLSFGLLVFSNTPALKIFGMTVAMGQCLIWTFTIFLRKKHGTH